MSRTLFRYIFLDLLKIFFMTSGVLAGIMSFGGLLRPLTENGLDVGQVGRMMTYLMPAMATYSLPVAALFATTVVYGRLSADNELTACRASGINYWVIATPALVMGLAVAIISLSLLCFTMPRFMIKVEKVVYSNMARYVATQIQRKHQIRIPGRNPVTVFATAATVADPDPARPDDQRVVLTGPMIITYDNKGTDETGQPLQVPKEFWMAREATAFIRPGDGDQITLAAVLTGGTKFPRNFAGALQGGIESSQFGPIPLPSPLRENTKFMDIGQLHALWRNPGMSRRVTSVVDEFRLRDQQAAFYRRLVAETDNDAPASLSSGADEQFVLRRGPGEIRWANDELEFTSRDAAAPGHQLLRRRHGETSLTAEARLMKVRARPDPANARLSVTVELYDAVVQTAGQQVPRSSFAQSFSIPMTPELAAIGRKTDMDYRADPQVSDADRLRLIHEAKTTHNKVWSEINSRASFAVSCWVLVFMGCLLGMMFRSGNFLSAFAVSFIPALLCITLIIAGQQTCDSVPWDLAKMERPAQVGIPLIWSGNAIVLLISAILGGKLMRQ